MIHTDGRIRPEVELTPLQKQQIAMLKVAKEKAAAKLQEYQTEEARIEAETGLLHRHRQLLQAVVDAEGHVKIFIEDIDRWRSLDPAKYIGQQLATERAKIGQAAIECAIQKIILTNYDAILKHATDLTLGEAQHELAAFEEYNGAVLRQYGAIAEP